MLIALFIAEHYWPNIVTRVEEGILALILAAITLVTFSQVIMRYGFNSGWGSAVEITTVLFAWLILFGMSYAVKINSHLGVDAFIRLLPPKAFKVAAIFGALAGVLYGVVLIYADWLQYLNIDTRGGALDYWSKMYEIGIGMEDIRYPVWAQEMFGLQERVHRWIIYLIIPTGLALFTYRCIEAVIDIARGDRELIIASHEAEELVEENKNILSDPKVENRKI